jgi:hypothetical protein
VQAVAAEAEAAAQQSESLKGQLAGLMEEEQELAARAEYAEAAIEGARQEAAKAKWRSIKVRLPHVARLVGSVAQVACHRHRVLSSI